MIIPVILSGGSGTRLWPLSRAQYPKQFLDLFSDRTMIQETILRLDGIKDIAQPMVVCNIDSRFIVAHQMMAINKNDAQIVLEPIAKKLNSLGIVMAGLDVIQDKVIEINVTSPCYFIKEVNDLYRTNLEKEICDYMLTPNLLSV